MRELQGRLYKAQQAAGREGSRTPIANSPVVSRGVDGREDGLKDQDLEFKGEMALLFEGLTNEFKRIRGESMTPCDPNPNPPNPQPLI